ncbi:hypothetical protein [Promicromonospora soli]
MRSGVGDGDDANEMIAPLLDKVDSDIGVTAEDLAAIERWVHALEH